MHHSVSFPIWLLFVILSTLPVYGQGFTKDEIHQSARKMLQNHSAWTGSIDLEIPSQENEDGSTLQKATIDSNLGSPKDFAGDIELGVFENATLVMASKDEYPALQIFDSKEDLVCHQTHGETAFDARKLAKLLRVLLDLDTISKQLLVAEQVEIRKVDDGFEVRFSLNSDMIQALEDVQSPIQSPKRQEVKAEMVGIRTSKPRAISVQANWKFDRHKTLTSIHYDVQYDDPIRSLLASARGGRVAIPAPGKSGANPTLGNRVIIDLERLSSTPDRILEVKKTAERLLKPR